MEDMDMFSCLPDEILGHIVSFLPNESALSTTLLSTRWRSLWNEAVIRYGALQDINGVIAEFLSHFQGLNPFKNPRRLQFQFGETSVLSASITSSNKVFLDFGKREIEAERRYELKLMLNENTHLPVSSNFLIKTLNLKSVCFSTSDVVSSILPSLHHLENLIISDCGGLESLSIEFNTKLLKLTILDCLQLKSLHLTTSRLRFFRYRGLLPQIWPENHFNLTDAMIDVRLGPSCCNFKTEDFDAVFLTIKNSGILTLCEWNFKELIWPSISPQSGSFIFYNLRELWWIVKDGESSDALVSLLRLCPALEQLFVTVDPKSYSTQRSNFCLLKQATKYTELQHLKLIKLMGFTKKEDEISMVKNLLQLVKGKPPRIEASDGSYLQILGNYLREKNKSTEHLIKENDIYHKCHKHPHMGL